MHLARLRKRSKTKHQHYVLPKKQCKTKCRLLAPSADCCLMSELVFDTTNKVLLTESKYLHLGLQTNHKSFLEKILKIFIICLGILKNRTKILKMSQVFEMVCCKN